MFEFDERSLVSVSDLENRGMKLKAIRLQIGLRHQIIYLPEEGEMEPHTCHPQIGKLTS